MLIEDGGCKFVMLNDYWICLEDFCVKVGINVEVLIKVNQELVCVQSEFEVMMGEQV